MDKEIKGLKVERTATGATLHIDNSFEGPAILKQDMGLGFLEPCLEISREGQSGAGTRSQQQPVTAILLRRGEAVRCGKFGDQRDVLF